MPVRKTGSRSTLAAVAALVFLGPWALGLGPDTVAAAVPGVKGTVVDASAGVLPGVTVTAQGADGRPLATTVTDAVGEFTFDGLPAGQVTLLFRLDGFTDAKATVTIKPAGQAAEKDSEKIVQRLELSGFSEAVTVRGAAPLPPVPPRVLAPVAAHDPASVCGPAKAEDRVPTFGVVKSIRTGARQAMFKERDELLIDPGLVNLLRVGDNFIVRRRFSTLLGDSRHPVTGEHSAGLLQIVDVDGPMATAVVVYACDEMMIGDFLAPFRPEPIRPAEAVGAPVFDKATRLLFADAGQMLGSTNRLLVIAQGARDGIETGQRLTIFRRSSATPAPVILGDAVVVAVRRESATIRVERTVDVIFLGHDGDWVAPQRSAETRKN
jgi:hypothetical protein